MAQRILSTFSQDMLNYYVSIQDIKHESFVKKYNGRLSMYINDAMANIHNIIPYVTDGKLTSDAVLYIVYLMTDIINIFKIKKIQFNAKAKNDLKEVMCYIIISSSKGLTDEQKAILFALVYQSFDSLLSLCTGTLQHISGGCCRRATAEIIYTQPQMTIETLNKLIVEYNRL